MKEWWQDKKKKRALKRIKKELEWWGFPVDQLNDEDIEKGLLEYALVVNKVNVTTKAFSDQLKKMASMYGAFNMAEALKELGDFLKYQDPKHYMRAMQYTMNATKTRVIVKTGEGVVTHPKEFAKKMVEELNNITVNFEKEEDNEVQGPERASPENKV